ncbi:GlsB/YeaQ/YmgE family stress response membrane protein [Haliscomenobacter hydrossis]|uniref:Transglycosylase-associated protein n=1 Tax=Haliscomenobacter hydrossis (strain ATCC 27775 / DSM 1100 / LMG 10767 / O) TaxID=760192 RepID=F4KS19_HALH1|nr:GlsB/YeaQ/YmgE family stress response membrane protein [Haliscomenobacter hydrossis]AEE51106.1 Transglycosylase-associated protein [Haliscomenobacter hydrossis DSM 1100]
MEIIYILIIGAVSGWLAGQIMKGGGFGLLWNIILGIVGSFVGGWVFNMLNISLNVGSATVNTIIQSVIGAVVVLFVAGLFRGR